MSLLSIQNLSLAFGHKPVVRDLSINVAAGEIVALVGESGSGKSLTLLSVMGLLPSNATLTGRIALGDRALAGADERTLRQVRGRDIGMVFQEPATALNPVRTILQQVLEIILLHKASDEVRARVMALDALARMGIDATQAARYPHQLSGGQRQRAAIATATVLKPKLILADEPTTALDVTTQAQMMQLLRERVADGAGLLLVTHDLALVAEYADRIAILKDGEIVEEGASPALLRNLQHPYAKSLLHAATLAPALSRVIDGPLLLRVQDAKVRYALPGGKILDAVKGVSFDLRAGESVAIVGESGSGKSSLARAILGLEKLAGGEITLDGLAPTGTAVRAFRRQVQLVFQDPFGSFDPRWKVARLVTEPLHLLDEKISPKEARLRATQALEDVGLGADALDRFPHEFSGGQRQRIAIARALMIKPKLVVFDEAVSALDVTTRARILDLLAALRERHNLTYLFITHDLHVARALAERIIVMREGVVVEEGLTANVFAAPKADYTKTLLKASPDLAAVLAR